jgi:preprotein translocase subunit SecA
MNLTREFRRTYLPEPPPVTKGVDASLERVVGSFHRRPSILRGYLKEAEIIDGLGSEFDDLREDALREQLQQLHQQFRRNPIVPDETLYRALAAIRTVAQRTTGLRPYKVQLVGALALHRGFLAEMVTGEGKTLTASMAGVLAGWTGLPTHIVTVNDYLAQRDAATFQLLYQYCGLSVGAVMGESSDVERVEAYNRDVTYTTSKEIVADFLRDRLRIGTMTDSTRRELRRLRNQRDASTSNLVMRGLHTAIVDEADSVLIDEAVTPVIISQPHENDDLSTACKAAGRIADQLIPDVDYVLDLRYKEINPTPAGKEKIEALAGELTGLWKSAARRRELVNQALNAREYFIRDKQYVVVDDKIVIVDELTGRQMPQRTWREGLHQAIEVKEGLELSPPSETLSRISFQRFFRQFTRLSGMTGTASESAQELWHIYNLPYLAIPTNRPCIREKWPDIMMPDYEHKWAVVLREVLRVHLTGRPVLVGTRSVKDSEKLAEDLERCEIDYSLLNAVHNDSEARIIEDAGKRGRITIATNMAGRGTDIELGRGIAALGGLHVIATERYDSPRIDRQLYGRAGRQGDPGSSQTIVSMEDEILKRFIPTATRVEVQETMFRIPRAGLNAAISCFDRAQQLAEKQAFKQRLSVLRTDGWLDDSLGFANPDAG